jgi:hypothetical protein
MEPEVVPATEVVPQVVEPVVEPTPETPPVAEPETPPVDDDEEPGGKSPLEVARRKEYERRVTAEARATALEEQLRLAKETPPEKPTIWTKEQVQTAIDGGRVSVLEGAVFLAKQEFQQDLEAREKKKAEQQPQEKALAEVNEFISVIPQIAVEGSEERRKVAAEVRRIMAEDGVPYDYITQRRAVRAVFGTLADQKKRAEVDRATRSGLRPAPVDAGGGGGGGGGANGKVDLAKAPATMVASWDSEGADQATRERRYRIYLDLKARKSVR